MESGQANEPEKISGISSSPLRAALWHRLNTPNTVDFDYRFERQKLTHRKTDIEVVESCFEEPLSYMPAEYFHFLRTEMCPGGMVYTD